MDEFLSKEEIITLKKTNKESLYKSKLDTLKFTDVIKANTSIKGTSPLLNSVLKADSSNIIDEINVKFIGNTAWFCDYSHRDVLTDTAYDSSLNNLNIKHLKDHSHTIEGIVGKISNVSKEVIDLKSFGYSGETTSLVFESLVKKSNDEKVYRLYKSNEIDQHSIGLRYKDISLAINSSDPDNKEEFETWNKYYPNIINKDVVDKVGYFWIVKDIDIFEVSCVLFGANPITPTLSIKSVIFDNNEKGINMNLEEALSENIKLTNEITQLKADLAVKSAKVKNDEQIRILSILEAAKTFNISNETVVKFAKSNIDVETAITSFEAIKEASQKENHVDTSGNSLSETVGTSTVVEKELSAKDFFLKAAQAGSKVDATFGGLL